MQVVSKGRSSSLRGRLAMVGASLLLVLAQVVPSVAYGAAGDGSASAALGAGAVVHVQVTCPDMGPAADGGTQLAGVVSIAGTQTALSGLTLLETGGTWTDGTLAADIPFTAPADAGTYDLAVSLVGRACVEGLAPVAVTGQLVVEAPAAPPTPEPVPAPAATDQPVGPLAVQYVTIDTSPAYGRVGAGTVTVAASTDGDGAISYESDDTDICTVVAGTGVVTPVAVGTCSITVTAAATEAYELATDSTSFEIFEAGVRGCVDYTGAAFLGAVVLNADGTPIGCGMTADEGAPADLAPDGWDAMWADYYANPDYNAMYSERLGYSCDDCWIGKDGEDGDLGLPIGFDINFYGTTYSEVFVNSNGSISFGSGSDNYDDSLDQVLDGAAGVVAYGVDLYNDGITGDEHDGPETSWGDERHQDFFYWGRTTYQGHDAFVATWMNSTDCCDDTNDVLATFQVMLVDIDDDGGDDLDIIVNYGGIDTSAEGYDAEEGCSATGDYYCVAIGLGTVVDGEVQYASIVDDHGTLYNGLATDVVADDGAHPLREGHLNNAVPGRFKFQMRDGELPQTATEPGAPAPSSEAGDITGTVEWTTPPKTGGSPILSYTLRYRVQGTSEWTEVTEAASPFVIPEFVVGTTYEVQVAAINGVGQGPWSATVYVPALPNTDALSAAPRGDAGFGIGLGLALVALGFVLWARVREREEEEQAAA